MWFQTLLNSLKTHKPARRKSPRSRPAAQRLDIEALEDRCVPASLSVSDFSLLEGNAGTRNALVTVTLTGAGNSPVTVEYSTARGTAVSGSDYQAVSGKLTFNRNETSRIISIPVIGDTLVESNEYFYLNLRNAKKATIADGQGVVTINNDDTQISIYDTWISEGNSGTTSFDFTVNLSMPVGQPLTVHYATSNGTASAGSDYLAASGNLTIPAGQSSGTVTVLVNGDHQSESEETFFVNLSNPTTGTIARSQGVGNIYDDEPHIYIGGASVAEGNSGTTALTFVVSLSTPATDVPVTVDFATADMTATVADSDYVQTSGTLTFAPGETSQLITVLVNGDMTVETDDYFAVNLSNATNARLDSAQDFGTILSDDNAVFHIDSYYGSEPDPYGGESVTFTFYVWLSTPSAETVTVNFTTIDGSAIAGYDYLPTWGQLTFAPGEMYQAIEVTIMADYESEWTEQFYVVLSDPSANALIQPGGDLGVGEIYDNQGYWW